MSATRVKQLTFSTHVEQFIFDRRSKNRSRKTILFYQAELGYFSDWLNKNGSPIVEQLTPDTLRHYFVELATHRNKGGVHCSYRVIKAFLNWYDSEYEPKWKNPIRKVQISPNNIEPLPEISLDDVQKLIYVCEGKNRLRDISILKVLVDTGLRASELVALNCGDIDFKTGAVKVKHGKGDKSRIVWIGNKGRKALLEYLSTRENFDSSPLFLNEDGERLQFFGLRQIIKRLCDKAGMKERGLHSFRRCFALSLYRKGIDILTISRLLGHSNIEVTKRYLNIGNEDLREAHSKASPADSLGLCKSFSVGLVRQPNWIFKEP